VIDFVERQVAGGQLLGLYGEVRRDVAGSEVMLQHVG
jgi:hypothetical protein